MLPWAFLPALASFLLFTSTLSAPTDLNGGADHRAHAVPGPSQTVVDWDNDGRESLVIDASLSHSHYFDPGPPIVSGRIVEYIWHSVASGRELLRRNSPFFRASFFVGRTALKLTVVDNTGGTASAVVQIMVLRPEPGGDRPPAVSGLSRRTAPTYGGTSIVVRGDYFYNKPRVLFGGVQGKILDAGQSNRIEVEVPPGFGRVRFFVVTDFGWSNAVDFDYVTSDDVQVQFKRVFLTNVDGDLFRVDQITSIKVGPDGRYYAGSLDGYIYRMEVNKDMIVTGSCKSGSVGSQRSILGLAFNPNEWEDSDLYISTSTLFWNQKPGNYSWNNGKVEVWRHGARGASCLGHVRDVITGLPVSGNDHGVNALEFTNNGDLLITVGSSTNAGVGLKQDKIGGIAESPLSAALVIAKLSRGKGFKGNIQYDQTDDPSAARITSGDSVAVFSAGIRNSFGVLRHSNGNVYLTNNGPNTGFGAKSTGCNSDGGTVAPHQDTLILAKANLYYGHPNRNRGRFDPRQCVFHHAKESDKGHTFTAPIAHFQSSTDGIIEYTANTFGFQLRGNIFASKFSSSANDGLLYQAVLTADGSSVRGKPKIFHGESGLSMTMSPYGDIIMPKVKQGKIIVLRPIEPAPQGPYVTAVTPRRGPRMGGNPVLITGYNFAQDLEVFIGNQPCVQLFGLRLEYDGSSVWCTVPPAKTDLKVSVYVRAGSETSRSMRGDYEYTF